MLSCGVLVVVAVVLVLVLVVMVMMMTRIMIMTATSINPNELPTTAKWPLGIRRLCKTQLSLEQRWLDMIIVQAPWSIKHWTKQVNKIHVIIRWFYTCLHLCRGGEFVVLPWYVTIVVWCCLTLLSSIGGETTMKEQAQPSMDVEILHSRSHFIFRCCLGLYVTPQLERKHLQHQEGCIMIKYHASAFCHSLFKPIRLTSSHPKY